MTFALCWSSCLNKANEKYVNLNARKLLLWIEKGYINIIRLVFHLTFCRTSSTIRLRRLPILRLSSSPSSISTKGLCILFTDSRKLFSPLRFFLEPSLARFTSEASIPLGGRTCFKIFSHLTLTLAINSVLPCSSSNGGWWSENLEAAVASSAERLGLFSNVFLDCAKKS